MIKVYLVIEPIKSTLIDEKSNTSYVDTVNTSVVYTHPDPD